MRDKEFEDVAEWTVGYESGWKDDGGLHTDPNDSGGTTRWGIAQSSHPDVNVAELERDQAMDIYRKEYWDPVKRMVPERTPKLRQAMFDGFVNGQRHGVRALQTAVGAKPDGKYGPKTKAAIEEATRTHGDEYLYNRFMRARSQDYKKIAEGQHPHLKGWLDRLRLLDDYIQTPKSD